MRTTAVGIARGVSYGFGTVNREREEERDPTYTLFSDTSVDILTDII